MKIKNQGQSAYKHEEYGDHIIVERQFSRSGASGFKIKSSTGRIITTKKMDLDDICDNFALQIDNPMNVLTQDMARQFLNNSNPYDKYKFFMKGTQLEMLDADYLQIEQSVDVIETGSEVRERDVKDLESKYRKAKRLLQLSREQDSLRDRITTLTHQMAWAQVEEQERVLMEHDKGVRKSANDIREAEHEVTKASERSEQAQQLHDVAERGMFELEEDLNPLLREEQEKTEIHGQKKAEAIDIHSQQRQIQSKIKEARQSKRKTEDNIQDEHRRLEDLNGGSHARRREEIEERRQEALQAAQALQEHGSQRRELEGVKQQAEDAERQSKEPIEAKNKDVQQCDRELQNLKRDRGQRQNAFNPNLPALLRAIQEDRGFQNKPVGPMAHHVRLTEPQWSSILEKTLGSALDAFVVTSKADQSRLSALARRLQCPCQVLIGQANAIKRIIEPDPKFKSMLRVLEIDSELVRNQLIIGQNIDQTILIEDIRDAHQLMDSERLANVKQCLSLLQNRKGAGSRTTYGHGGSLTETFIGPWQGLPRMKTDVEFQINQKSDFLADLKSELNHLETQRRAKMTALKEANQAIVRHERRHQQLTLESQRAQQTVESLEDALERDAVEEGRLDELQKILKEAVDEVSTYEDQYENSVLALDKAKLEMETASGGVQEIQARVTEAKRKIDEAEEKARKFESQMNETASVRVRAVAIVGRLERRKREVEDIREEKAKIVEEFIGEASKISERVPVPAGETGDSLDKKLMKLTDDVERAERQ